MQRLAIVVPCYNEEPVMEESAKQLTGVIQNLIDKNKIAPNSFVLFVNDGSKDRTWELIQKEFEKSKYVHGLNLAGNVGHQNALLAGLMTAKDMSDMCVSIDADLQDDVNVIEEMVDQYVSGYDIVYGVRSARKTDTFFKRTTAEGFYKVMKFMGIKSVYNHADYRLMSKRAVEQLGEYKERNLFLRGIVPLIGYQTTCVYYERKERFAGESKYPLKKMMSFAFDGITSFSTKPMTFILGLGLFMVFISILAGIYAFISYIAGHVVGGWTSLILSLWFIGGLVLFSLGLIGQYIGKIYIEVKERPRYNIAESLHHED
ncbi:MAG TPA: glycosyltransferase family 2 protein [Lachnospiraceae bacterium]|nr:glycosyltransferase family 2 protein [Lachnospiraceae bacterium]